MAMEHKAYVFDASRFRKELLPLIFRAVDNNDDEALRRFIVDHVTELRSPYTGEQLGLGWEAELESNDIQELADFGMTRYYDPNDDRGLSYGWDGLVEALRGLGTTFDPEYAVLGRAIVYEEFTLDPGAMGTGLVEPNDVGMILSELRNVRGRITDEVVPRQDEVLYAVTLDDLINACDTMLELFGAAAELRSGILVTF